MAIETDFEFGMAYGYRAQDKKSEDIEKLIQWHKDEIERLQTEKKTLELMEKTDFEPPMWP